MSHSLIREVLIVGFDKIRELIRIGLAPPIVVFGLFEFGFVSAI